VQVESTQNIICRVGLRRARKNRRWGGEAQDIEVAPEQHGISMLTIDVDCANQREFTGGGGSGKS
jgi:hypothetical protein